MKLSKKIGLILSLTVVTSIVISLHQRTENQSLEVQRNTYGEGSRIEELYVKTDEDAEVLEVEIFEQEYTAEEIEVMFDQVIEELDTVILGENESFDRVDKDLNLVNSLEKYPVDIVWEMDSYKAMNWDGTLKQEDLLPEGIMVELRGTITYLEERVIYVRNVMVYPEKLEGKELFRQEILDAIQSEEKNTREEKSFTLPQEVNGTALSWSKKKEMTGLYILFIGIMLSVFLLYREREQVKQAEDRRKKELLREYPGMLTKFHVLLNAGMTVRSAWEKIVQNYEKQKEQLGDELVYEEMSTTLHEIKGGIPEGEAYERFGRRCGLTCYLKFSAMLSQNLRKGSKGISELLRMETIQAFENRKSLAKKLGEEAGTKLLIPMIGMLAVILIMVMVPAFLSMQI